jgi:hypothetical protein
VATKMRRIIGAGRDSGQRRGHGKEEQVASTSCGHRMAATGRCDCVVLSTHCRLLEAGPSNESLTFQPRSGSTP